MTIRKLPAQGARVETGPVQFGDDWPGIFIRGDDAAYFATIIKTVIDGRHDPQANGLTTYQLKGIGELLSAANLNACPATDGGESPDGRTYCGG